MIQSIIDARIPQPTVTNQVLVWNNTTGLFEASVSLSGLTLNSPVIAGDFSWTGDSAWDCDDARKIIRITPGINSALSFISNGNNYIDIDTGFIGSYAMNFGNDTDNPAFNFLGTGLTTLGGSLLVNGGFIGDTDDDELIEIDGAGGTFAVGGYVDIDAGPFTSGAIAMFSTEDASITGMGVANTSLSSGADQRFIMLDTTGHYIAMSCPGVNNSGSLFGVSRSSADFIFNLGGTARDLVIGTVANKDLRFGTSNITRGILSAAGDMSFTGDVSGATLTAGDGFTGTGAYTNFTITNGIITAAA